MIPMEQIANSPGREEGLPALLDPEAALETSASHAVTVIPAASSVALTLPPILAGSFTPEIRSRVEHFYTHGKDSCRIVTQPPWQRQPSPLGAVASLILGVGEQRGIMLRTT